MNMRKNLGAVALALGVLGTSTLAAAAVNEIEIRTAPPADRAEMVPAPRPGFIYEKGHYAYDGGKYVWTEGNFFKEREGYKYTPYAFEKRGESYYYRPGFWNDNQK